MKSKINNLEKRLEEQEQYSRRRLTNVKVPTNGNNVKVPTNGNNVKVPTNGHNVKVPTKGNNVKVPTNGNNVVKTPIDADSLVLGICKKTTRGRA